MLLRSCMNLSAGNQSTSGEPVGLPRSRKACTRVFVIGHPTRCPCLSSDLRNSTLFPLGLASRPPPPAPSRSGPAFGSGPKAHGSAQPPRPAPPSLPPGPPNHLMSARPAPGAQGAARQLRLAPRSSCAAAPRARRRPPKATARLSSARVPHRRPRSRPGPAKRLRRGCASRRRSHPPAIARRAPAWRSCGPCSTQCSPCGSFWQGASWWGWPRVGEFGEREVR